MPSPCSALTASVLRSQPETSLLWTNTVPLCPGHNPANRELLNLESSHGELFAARTPPVPTNRHTVDLLWVRSQNRSASPNRSRRELWLLFCFAPFFLCGPGADDCTLEFCKRGAFRVQTLRCQHCPAEPEVLHRDPVLALQLLLLLRKAHGRPFSPPLPPPPSPTPSLGAAFQSAQTQHPHSGGAHLLLPMANLGLGAERGLRALIRLPPRSDAGPHSQLFPVQGASPTGWQHQGNETPLGRAVLESTAPCRGFPLVFFLFLLGPWRFVLGQRTYGFRSGVFAPFLPLLPSLVPPNCSGTFLLPLLPHCSQALGVTL